MNQPLAQRPCIPCQGGTPPLETAAKERLLAQLHPDWTLKEEGRRLYRPHRCRDFKSAWSLFNRIAALAEEEQHHPDIAVGHGYLNITLFTHKISDLVESDFIMAAKIDALLTP